MKEEAITKMMLEDAFVAVENIFGLDGLQEVVEHMKRANRAREDQIEIDDLEKIFARRT